MRSLLASPWSPWAFAPAVLGSLWLLEAAVHVGLYPGAGYFDQLLQASTHETWMRFLVVFAVLVASAASSAGIRERARRERESAEHEQALAVATARAARAESETRSRLSKRLHEGVNQELAAARMFLASATDAIADDGARAAVASAGRILDRSIAECRDIAQELSPPVLDEYGLAPALEVLAQRVTRATGTPVRLDASDRLTEPVERDVLMTAFHVVTALVEQAAECENTSFVRMCVTSDAGEAVVSLDWDGCGRPEVADARARLARVGGSVHAERSGDGAAVQVRVPTAA